MEYSPKGETKRSDILIIGLFALGIASFAAVNFITRYAFALRLVGLFALTGAVYVAVRYRLTRFVYSISGDEGGEVFTVYRDRGRRSVAECRLSLSYLRSVRRYESREEMKPALAGHDIYAYSQSMTPATFVVAIFESTGERDIAVVLECDEAFERELTRFVR